MALYEVTDDLTTKPLMEQSGYTIVDHPTNFELFNLMPTGEPKPDTLSTVFSPIPISEACVSIATLNTVPHFAIALLLHPALWSIVDSVRSKHDKAYGRWPPHINLIWPAPNVNTTLSLNALVTCLNDALIATGKVPSIATDSTGLCVYPSIGTFSGGNTHLAIHNDAKDEQYIASAKWLYALQTAIATRIKITQKKPFSAHLTLGQGKDVSASWDSSWPAKWVDTWSAINSTKVTDTSSITIPDYPLLVFSHLVVLRGSGPGLPYHVVASLPL